MTGQNSAEPEIRGVEPGSILDSPFPPQDPRASHSEVVESSTVAGVASSVTREAQGGREHSQFSALLALGS